MKKFLVQIQGGDNTRFPMSDEELARAIRDRLQPLIRFCTSGKVPLVEVIPEEEPALCKCHREAL